MSETKIEIKMPDGLCEAFLFTPQAATGKGGFQWPGVVYLTDIMGIRPAYHKMAQRLADNGYVVLLPNIFFRASKLPVLDFVPQMGDEKTMKRMGELRAGLSNAQMGPDAESYADFLLAQPMVKGPKVGVVGYCFTGSMTVRAVAQAPSKFAAAASFHGGGLLTEQPDSPHLLLPKISTPLYFGHAVRDRSMPAETIAKFEEALKSWAQTTGHKSESETYEGALHGWCVPGRAEVYNEPQAERHWVKLTDLLRETLC